jgi:hypothetical protein
MTSGVQEEGIIIPTLLLQKLKSLIIVKAPTKEKGKTYQYHPSLSILKTSLF